MKLIENDIYHIYNRGNNRQQVYFYDDHYEHFIKLMKKNILPYCEMLAWCLMPNHFHFLIQANARSIMMIEDDSFPRQRFSQGIKQLLSMYTKAVNLHMDFTGSRFQQKTRGKNVSEEQYATTAFHYIHQNPIKAGLVQRIEDWPFSSFNEYTGNHPTRLCNRQRAFDLIDTEPDTMYNDTYDILSDFNVANIFNRHVYGFFSSDDNSINNNKSAYYRATGKFLKRPLLSFA